MNKKHLGASFFEDVKKWEKEDPAFRKKVDEYIEKKKIAMVLKKVREQENLTQSQLAEKAHVTQSVIARIESGEAKTLPRLDLFNRILASVGYHTSIVAKKRNFSIKMALSA
jgi:DNA-binding XRE family transcriptional regulator